jgi:hypothetical protein
MSEKSEYAESIEEAIKQCDVLLKHYTKKVPAERKLEEVEETMAALVILRNLEPYIHEGIYNQVTIQLFKRITEMLKDRVAEIGVAM